MVLPFEFVINRAGIEPVKQHALLDSAEQKHKMNLERKLLEVRDFTPDVSHILMEPVPLTSNLSFLDTSLQDRASDDRSSPLREPEVREIQIADDDESMLDDDDLVDDDDGDDDDDAFP